MSPRKWGISTSPTHDYARSSDEPRSSNGPRLPDAALARLLNNLSIRLSALGRRQDSRTAIREAVTILRQLAETHPDAHLPELARSLNNLSLRVGRHEDDLTAVLEAITIRQRLAEAHPDAYLPALAESLRVLSWWRRSTATTPARRLRRTKRQHSATRGLTEWRVSRHSRPGTIGAGRARGIRGLTLRRLASCLVRSGLVAAL
jgi:hypothetical protein